MNTPGKPSPSWRQSKFLFIALAIVLVIVGITLFAPW